MKNQLGRCEFRQTNGISYTSLTLMDIFFLRLVHFMKKNLLLWISICVKCFKTFIKSENG
jgi:hypothetical protein